MANDQISAETLRKLQEKTETLRQIMVRLGGGADYTSTVEALRADIDAMPSSAFFAHDLAQKLMPEATQGNTVRPEQFSEIVGLIDTKEKSDAILAQMSEFEGQQIIQYLSDFLTCILPKIRKDGIQRFKQLPHGVGGGRSKLVDEERADNICAAIAKLYEAGVSIGDAQRRVAAQQNLGERTIRAIWQNRKKTENPPKTT